MKQARDSGLALFDLSVEGLTPPSAFALFFQLIHPRRMRITAFTRKIAVFIAVDYLIRSNLQNKNANTGTSEMNTSKLKPLIIYLR